MQLRKPFDGNYPITQKYGEKYTNEAGHNGIDYALPFGTPVLAASDGEVWKAGIDNTGYGNYVILKHAWNAGTVYGHLRNWNVIPGQSVKAGDIIGYSGNSGNSTGPHLHFEYRLTYNDWKSATDPDLFLVGASAQTDQPVSSTGWAEVVCEEGANMRETPAGALKTWIPKGVRVHLTGNSSVANNLTWVEIDGGYWVARVDSEGTTLIEGAQ
jgi:hypothetical protein